MKNNFHVRNERERERKEGWAEWGEGGVKDRKREVEGRLKVAATTAVAAAAAAAAAAATAERGAKGPNEKGERELKRQKGP